MLNAQAPGERAERPRIVFLVMSAVAPAAIVDQLAHALAPHRVLIHHDFHQAPTLPLTADNVCFVPEPRRTGWATFGFVEGIFHSLEWACRHLRFDYLQLLSPTCLPVRPLAQFEAHVAAGVQAHVGAIDLLADADCLMNVGYRAFTPEGTFAHRALRRLVTHHYPPGCGRRDEAGVWLRSGGRRGPMALATRLAVRAAGAGLLSRHPFDGAALRPHYGSVWFGAREPVVRGMVEAFADPRLRAWCSRLRISEEILVPTLLAKLAATRGPLNHFVNRFDEAHPRRIDMPDMDAMRASGAFFARKFPDAVGHPVRTAALRELAQAPQAALDIGQQAGEDARRKPPKPAAGAADAATPTGLPALEPVIGAAAALAAAAAAASGIDTGGLR